MDLSLSLLKKRREKTFQQRKRYYVLIYSNLLISLIWNVIKSNNFSCDKLCFFIKEDDQSESLTLRSLSSMPSRVDVVPSTNNVNNQRKSVKSASMQTAWTYCMNLSSTNTFCSVWIDHVFFPVRDDIIYAPMNSARYPFLPRIYHGGSRAPHHFFQFERLVNNSYKFKKIIQHIHVRALIIWHTFSLQKRKICITVHTPALI
jgi:hypothetical protein